jgi:hypothetical protein
VLLQGIGGVGGGKCYFVDSQASNNWIAHRVRNGTHNYVYAESYGKQAMHAPTPVRLLPTRCGQINRLGRASCYNHPAIPFLRLETMC